MSTSQRSRRRRLPLRWTDRALADLQAVGDFIAVDNPAAAAKWVRDLIATAERAARVPFAGRRLPEFARDDLREVLRRNYRIVYRIRTDAVEVITVFEAHRLLPEMSVEVLGD